MRLLVGVLDKPTLAARRARCGPLALQTGTASGLGVFVPNKATLCGATSAFGAAARLQIAVTDKPTLRFAATVHSAAIGLAVGVFDEAAFRGLGQCPGCAAHQGAQPKAA